MPNATFAQVSNLLLPHKTYVRPSLEYRLHVRGEASPSTFSILDSIQNRAVRLVGDEALSSSIEPLSLRLKVPDLRFLYRYFLREKLGRNLRCAPGGAF